MGLASLVGKGFCSDGRLLVKFGVRDRNCFNKSGGIRGRVAFDIVLVWFLVAVFEEVVYTCEHCF